MNFEDMMFFVKKILSLANNNLNQEETKVFVNSFKIKAGNFRAEIRALISM